MVLPGRPGGRVARCQEILERTQWAIHRVLSIMRVHVYCIHVAVDPDRADGYRKWKPWQIILSDKKLIFMQENSLLHRIRLCITGLTP